MALGRPCFNLPHLGSLNPLPRFANLDGHSLINSIIGNAHFPRNLTIFWFGVSLLIALLTPGDVLSHTWVRMIVDLIAWFYPPAGDHYGYSDIGGVIRFYFASMLLLMPIMAWSLFLISDKALQKYVRVHRINPYYAILGIAVMLLLAVFGLMYVPDPDSTRWNRIITQSRIGLGIMGAIQFLFAPYIFRCFIMWRRFWEKP